MSKLLTMVLSMALLQSFASAETISCNAVVLKATKKTESEKSVIYAQKLELTKNADGIFQAKMKYKNIELGASAYKDERLDVYDLSYYAFDTANNSSEIRDQVLLFGTGPSEQNGWEGPAGSSNYNFVRSSIQPLPMVGAYTQSAMTKLSALGIKSRSISNFYQNVDLIAEAVRSGVFKEGEVIGAGFVLNCFAK